MQARGLAPHAAAYRKRSQTFGQGGERTLKGHLLPICAVAALVGRADLLGLF